MTGSRAFRQSTSATLGAGGGAVGDWLADVGDAEAVVGVEVADAVADVEVGAAVRPSDVEEPAAGVVTDGTVADPDVDDGVHAASAATARPATTRAGVRRVVVIWFRPGSESCADQCACRAATQVAVSPAVRNTFAIRA
jgi:hypothetical protein